MGAPKLFKLFASNYHYACTALALVAIFVHEIYEESEGLV
jgi:hypothetical protein